MLGRKLLIKEAISTGKKDAKQNKRPNFVLTYRRPRVIPGNKLYVATVNELEVEATHEERNYSRQPQRKKNFIISDSHLTRIKKNSKEIRCILNALVEQMPNSWIIM